MVSQTKMVIITSNEDLIRQFASKPSDKTRIIELDDDVDLTALANDRNNLIDLAFLAQLSELVRRSFSPHNNSVSVSTLRIRIQMKFTKKSWALVKTLNLDRRNPLI